VYGITAAHELEVRLHVVHGYPVTVNDPDFAAFVRDVASSLVGDDAVIDLAVPVMGSEDFAYILERVPGAMVFLGARAARDHPQPLHSNNMLIEEDAMETGIALHTAIALRYLADES
jgi:hippurate hydrolase